MLHNYVQLYLILFNLFVDFNYTAISKNGQRESGSISAQNAALAGHLLKEQGLLPIEILPQTGSYSLLGFLKNATTITLSEKISFIENLGIMLKAGIPLSRGMKILVKQTRNFRMKNILTDVAAQVESGKSIAEALSKYPRVFSPIFINMVKVGELSGKLNESLEYLTNQLHREADLKSKTKGAMIYPAVIVTTMAIIGVLMAIFVLPKLTSIFKEFDSDLPVLTRGVIAVADFMSGNAVVVIAGIVVITFGVISLLNTYSGKKYFHIFLLHFFTINTIIKKINLARYSRVLSSLLKSGVPIVEALQVASDSITNIPYKELTAQAAVDVKLGKTLTDSLGKNTTLFPILVVQMLQVGEESGTVETMLEQLAEHYEEEVDTTMRNLSTIIEPLLLLFIGGVVAILALALIGPIYNISQSIQ